MESKRVTVLILLSLISTSQSDENQLPAYYGLLPAQVPLHDLAGIDLFLDSLKQLATWCFVIGFGIPIFKLDLWKPLLAIWLSN